MTTTETTESSFNKARHKLTKARIELMGQLAKFSSDELVQHPIAGELSPLELAHYVYIADGFGLEQMKVVQTEANPVVADIDEHAPQLKKELEEATSLEAVLAGMAARREEIFEYLFNLPEEAWARPFRHPHWGERKFYEMVNMLASHDQQQAQQLSKLRATS